MIYFEDPGIQFYRWKPMEGFYRLFVADALSDSYIANELGVSVDHLNEMMLSFNATFYRSEFFFQRKLDAEKALEWANSMFLIKQLTKSVQ